MTTPASTIEAIICSVKARGVAALTEPSNIQRLRGCDSAARKQIDRRIAAIIAEGGAAPEEPRHCRDQAIAQAGNDTTEAVSGNPEQKSEKQDDDKKEKQVTVLLAIAQTARDNQQQQGGEPPRQCGSPLFHSPAPDREAYADIIIDGHRETHPVRGRSFKRFLRHQYFRRTQCGCNAEALKTATETIAALAEFEGAERPVYCRIAGCDGGIYIDIGDATWRAIRVTTRGWGVVDRPPVRFIRSASTKALPLPRPGGSVAALRPFCNLKSEGDFVLFVAYILATLRPDANYPVLAVTGEQGSSKSTLGRIAQELTDPRIPAQRTFPRDEAELFVAAKGAHLLNFDNISGLPDWLSDAICRISTGGGAGRRLYSDDEEILFFGRRPVFLNGIEDVVVRPDLVDRALMLTLERIPDANRRDEKEFYAEFELAGPEILGVLLDGLVAGLGNLPTVQMLDKFRMADFGLFGEACTRAYWPPGTFLKAYRDNLDAAVELVLESSPVGDAVRRFMGSHIKWSGTASDLLPLLTTIVGDQIGKERSWPKRADALSGKLRRSAPVLRKTGIDVTFLREGHAGKRTIEIRKQHNTEEGRKTASGAPAASATNGNSNKSGRTGPEDADAVLTRAATEGVSDKSLRNKSADAADTAAAAPQPSMRWRARV